MDAEELGVNALGGREPLDRGGLALPRNAVEQPVVVVDGQQAITTRKWCDVDCHDGVRLLEVERWHRNGLEPKRPLRKGGVAPTQQQGGSNQDGPGLHGVF